MRMELEKMSDLELEMSTQVMDEVKGKDKNHSEAACKAGSDEGQGWNPGEYHR